ncbi:MBL fold metallo-hydrolase [Agreia bicolorata]|uniref:Beta-lactamase n=1 Tax=Agreia bicolorata TaxID=110935 RepID=A0ABR5CC51_9MICO|nr:MBL fold metallo-hydrolase [Agreia bicolorata]KJC63097.1 beta-lactamase [Agreia bicolorata]
MSVQHIQLTVLGSSTPYPSADNPCSGYLVTSGTTKLWIDAGTGTLGPLQQHIALGDLDAIWISHLHADHSADLLTAFYALVAADITRRPVPLYGPPGIAERLTHYLTNGSTPAPIDRAFEIHELHDLHQAQVGNLLLTSRSVSHGIPAFGVRIASPTTSLVFSGDTAPCANLTDLAVDCDALLCESESTAAPHDAPQVHHTPENAGTTATDSRAGRLIVTHVGRSLTPADALARAATRYSGPIEFAAPGTTFAIG